MLSAPIALTLASEGYMGFQIRVLAFGEGEVVPKRYTCDGENVSPPIEWKEPPPGTKTFALIVDDPDAPSGIWNHWLLWDIPAADHGLAEGFQAGRIGVSGLNDFGKQGYGGPCPPAGHGPHRYFFKLYAIDTSRLMLPAGSKRWELDKALRGHVIGETWAMGKFERR